MSNQKQRKIIANILSINLFAFIGIGFAVVFVSFYLLYTENYAWDPPNWVTLIVEVGIGLAIASSILIYSNYQQKRFSEQQDRISDLVTQVKNLTEEQKKIREGRHRWALVLLQLELKNLKILLNDDPYQGIYLEAEKLANNITQIINQHGEVIEPSFLYDITKICETIHNNTNDKKMITENIFNDNDLKSLVNHLISQFEMIYPSV